MMRMKHGYVRSNAILTACRELPCQHCGRDDGTVVAAHSNGAVHGKGRGIKADDSRVAALCCACHHIVDQSMWPGSERERIWSDAHNKTVRELVRRGAWPGWVPVPEEFDGEVTNEKS